MLTAAGSGYSRWGKLAVTRWREDATSDDFGSYIFLRDVRTEAVWSAAFQPIGDEPDSYHVAFNEDRAEFTRRDGALTTTLDVVVSSEDDSEVRRVSVTNSGARMREIEITSYAELVLAPQAADIAHPAFSKLFVETEFLADVGALVATRRRRAPDEPEVWVGQLAVVDGESVGETEFETDRARFLGRGQGIRTPIAMIDGRRLSNSVGAVLDPIFALRRRVRIAPGAVARISFWTMAASTRETLLDIVDKHRDAAAFSRATTLAWTQAQVQLHHLGVTAGEASLFQRLASPVIYANATLRPPSPTILAGSGAQSGLWAQGISGDLPIVLLRINDADDLDVARELLQAHEYWRMKRLAVDLVILNERQSSYVQDLQIALETLIRARQMRPRLPGEDSGGAAFVLRSDLIPAETSALLASIARVVIVAQRGGLLEQLERIVETARPSSVRAKRRIERAPRPASPLAEKLEFFNGLGGFARDGQDYVTILGPGQATPAPWINVVANESFGFQAATEGGGYTWSVNSRENQLTPWSNDPVSDRSGEAFFLRDDDTGDFWSPTALPIRLEEATYVARFGRGYCRFEHTSHDIEVRSAAIRAGRRCDQDFAPETAQSQRSCASSQRHRLCRMGARPVALGRPAVRDDFARFHRRDFRPEPLGRGFRRARRLRRSWRAPDRLDRRPSRIHRPQRDAAPTGGRGQRRRLSKLWAPASIPARRCAPASRSRPAPASKSSSCSARARIRRRRVASSNFSAPPISTRFSRRWANIGTRFLAPSPSRRRIAPWTSCSTAGCSTRPSPAASGRARPSIRPAAPMVFATSCRTCWRWRPRIRP